MDYCLFAHCISQASSGWSSHVVGSLLNSQRIRKQAYGQAKWKYQDGVENGQNDSRLKIPDHFRDLLPRFPRLL